MNDVLCALISELAYMRKIMRGDRHDRIIALKLSVTFLLSIILPREA